MSTGGAIDEDGINQSVVYASSIRSVRRRLDDDPESAAQIVLNSNLQSSETMGGIEEELKQEVGSAATPNRIVDFIFVQDDSTPVTANFDTYTNIPEPTFRE